MRVAVSVSRSEERTHRRSTSAIPEGARGRTEDDAATIAPIAPRSHVDAPRDQLAGLLAREVARRAHDDAAPPHIPERDPITGATLQRSPEWMKPWKWFAGAPEWMKPWKWFAGAPAPAHAAVPAVAVAPTPARTRYANTSIQIDPSNNYASPPADGRDYVTTVSDHLDDIAAVIGNGFFAALGAKNRQQLIVYGGSKNNQCAGYKTGYVMLRNHHDSSDCAAFGVELTKTLGDMGINDEDLAAALRQQGLPRWSGATDAAPINDFSDANATRAKVSDWLAGRSLPNRDEMDVLMLIVQANAKPGVGVGSRINYDPLKMDAASRARPPQVALFHELIHAYYNSEGTQLGREDSLKEDNGGRLFELMAVGMPPFDTRPYSENAIRKRWHPVVAPRNQYP